MRAIHFPHPNGNPHPFKFSTLCGKMVRFGGLAIENERPATCKTCLKIHETICTACGGTGVKPKQPAEGEEVK